MYLGSVMQQLLLRIQYHNDQEAFKQLYKHLFFRLYQFAFSYLKTKEGAEEVVNDVFLRLWQKRNTLNTITNINVYLYVAVKNASLNYLRKNKIAPPLSLTMLTTDHIKLTSNPESLFITRELQIRIREAVEQLPPRCKMIFKLIKEDGLSYKEVAAILEISVKTVDAQLCLALKKLANRLLPVWKEYHPSTSSG
jgi:RNA polymerase sigma-70 factor (ECF subfamily)